MAWHFFRRRRTWPDHQLLQKVPRQAAWRGTFLTGVWVRRIIAAALHTFLLSNDVGTFQSGSVQSAAGRFHGGQQRAGAEQALDGFDVAVQRAVPAERADVLAQVLVCRLGTLARAQRAQKL